MASEKPETVSQRRPASIDPEDSGWIGKDKLQKLLGGLSRIAQELVAFDNQTKDLPLDDIAAVSRMISDFLQFGLAGADFNADSILSGINFEDVNSRIGEIIGYVQTAISQNESGLTKSGSLLSASLLTALNEKTSDFKIAGENFVKRLTKGVYFQTRFAVEAAQSATTALESASTATTKASLASESAESAAASASQASESANEINDNIAYFTRAMNVTGENARDSSNFAERAEAAAERAENATKGLDEAIEASEAATENATTAAENAIEATNNYESLQSALVVLRNSLSNTYIPTIESSITRSNTAISNARLCDVDDQEAVQFADGLLEAWNG